MENATAAYEFSGIYQLLNLSNGKRYVGQAQNIANRIREHRRKRNGQSGTNRLYNAVKKYGWACFSWSVLERVDDLSRLDEREKFWIDALEVCDESKGYNICAEPHTTRGWQHTDATKSILREQAGKKVGARNPFFGRTHSAATKASIGAKNATRVRTAAEKERLRTARATSGSGRPARPVDQLDAATGEVVRTWASASDACRALGISIGSLVGCCQGQRGRRTAKGFRWRYTPA